MRATRRTSTNVATSKAEASRKKSRHCKDDASKYELNKDSAPQESCVTLLPVEVLAVIGSHLRLPDLLNARLACKLWSHHVGQGEAACLQLQSDFSKLHRARQINPAATKYRLRTCGQSTQKLFDDYISELGAISQVQELQVVRITAIDPKYHVDETPPRQLLSSIRVVANLPHLTSLQLADCPFPSVTDLTALAGLSCLTSLSISATSARDLVVDVPLSGAGPSRAPELPRHAEHAGADHLYALASGLQHLKHLEVPVHSSPDTVAALHNLAALTRLTTLAVSGAPFTVEALDKTIGPLKKLQVLHVVLGDSLLTLHQSLALQLTNLACVGLTLHNHSALPTCLAACPMPSQLEGRLTKLVVVRSPLDNSVVSSMAALTSLQHLELRGCISCSPLEQGSIMLADLAALSTLTRLTALHWGEVAGRVVFNLHQSLPKLVLGLQHSLKSLELSGLHSAECKPSTLRCLSSLQRLQNLEIKGCDSTSMLLELGLDNLPQGLESLSLRYVAIQQPNACSQLSNLTSLTLSHCQAVTSLDALEVSMARLPGLGHLELTDMPQLRTSHFSHLAALTQLTSLAMSSTGNQHVGNSALSLLTTLTRLRKLRWSAGDILDNILDPVILKSFPNLHLLTISTSMYFRMARWSALGVMEFLPFCQLEAVGP